MSFITIVGILAIAYGVFESFFAGEKYFRWFLRQYGKDINNYDVNRIKKIRFTCLILLGLTCFSVRLFEGKLFWMPVVFATVVFVIHWIVVVFFL